MVNPSKTKKRPLTVQEKNFKKLLHKLGHEIKLAKLFKEQADELHNKKSSRQSANLSINAAKNLKENQYAYAKLHYLLVDSYQFKAKLQSEDTDVINKLNEYWLLCYNAYRDRKQYRTENLSEDFKRANPPQFFEKLK